MHPKEFSHMAMAAASAARLDGFSALADALMTLAAACEDEACRANQLEQNPGTEKLVWRPLSEKDIIVLVH
jgi:hypothetical protein